MDWATTDLDDYAPRTPAERERGSSCGALLPTETNCSQPRADIYLTKWNCYVYSHYLFTAQGRRIWQKWSALSARRICDVEEYVQCVFVMSGGGPKVLEASCWGIFNHVQSLLFRNFLMKSAAGLKWLDHPVCAERKRVRESFAFKFCAGRMRQV